MSSFDPNAYGPILADLLNDVRLNSLGPDKPNEGVRAILSSLSIEKAVAPRRIQDASMANTCLAGLWLYHNFLDESHTISQEIKSSTGSYWHGIMHRREPDAGNAAYWFRRVGEHPIFGDLAADALALGYPGTSNRWNPFEFIELCEKNRDTGSKEEVVLKRVQLREWQLLFDWCHSQAVGIG